MKWKFGYKNGFIDGVSHEADRGERIIAVLREQLADSHALAREQSQRADLAVDQLIAKLGFRGVTTIARAESNDRMKRIQEQLDRDPFEEVAIGDPAGTFQSVNEALLGPSLQGANGDGDE